MDTFEYKTITVKTSRAMFQASTIDTESLDATLNKLGKEGWELVSTSHMAKDGGYKTYLNLFLKRKLN